jgi:integrase/recombinase XerD
VKIDRHGKAKVLSAEEIQRLFTSVMLYTACRVKECVTLRVKDVYDSKVRVRPELIIRKGNTKGKLATRTIPVLDDLRQHLKVYKPLPTLDGYLFPGRWGKGHIHEDSAAFIFREACKRAGIEGASTHSCRRTALTLMSNAGIPLRVIQEVSGHRNLEQLQKYLEVEESQVRGAIAALSMLTPVNESSIGKYIYPDVSPSPDNSPISSD